MNRFMWTIVINIFVVFSCTASISVVVHNRTNRLFTVNIKETYPAKALDYEQDTKTIKPLQTKQLMWIDDPLQAAAEISDSSEYHFMIKLTSDKHTLELQQLITLKKVLHKKHYDVYYAISRTDTNNISWYTDTQPHTDKIVQDGVTFVVSYRKYSDKLRNTVIEYALQEEPAPYVTTKPEQLRMLSWNIDMKPHNLVKNGQLQRASLIVPFLSGYDVVILTDLFDQSVLPILTQKLNQEYPYTTTTTYTKYGVAIFSKWPIDKIEAVGFDHLCSGFDCQISKGIVFARILKDGHPYNVFGVTLQDWPSNRAALVRTEQLKKLKILIDSLEISHDEPLLISGTFNINKYKSSFDDKGKNEYEQMLHILNAHQGTHKGYLFTVDPSHNSLSRIIDPKEYNDYVLYTVDYKNPKDFSSEVCIFKSGNAWHEHFDKPYQDLSSHFALCNILEF